jgi:Nucleotide-binding protein implicated in inhibition of septum formation
MQLILASQSPRRKQLLTDAALEFEIVIVPTDESYPDHLTRAEVPEFIAADKALAVYQLLETTGKLKRGNRHSCRRHHSTVAGKGDWQT